MKFNNCSFMSVRIFTKKKKMDQKESVRLNKAISDSGYCSRREADVLIEKGRVTLNGKQAVLGDRVYPEDEVKIDGKPIDRKSTRLNSSHVKISYAVFC